MTFSWFFLSTLNYDARSTTHQICKAHYVVLLHTFLAGASVCARLDSTRMATAEQNVISAALPDVYSVVLTGQNITGWLLNSVNIHLSGMRH